jgi:hypothetical protein
MWFLREVIQNARLKPQRCKFIDFLAKAKLLLLLISNIVSRSFDACNQKCEAVPCRITWPVLGGVLLPQSSVQFGFCVLLELSIGTLLASAG